MSSSVALLDLRDLVVEYPGSGLLRRGRPVLAVDGVSLTLRGGQTLGLVGESGSGKSTIGKAILGLVRPTAGQVEFRGQDITLASRGDRRALSEHLQVVFQDPYSSLNPLRTIGQTLAEPLRIARRTSRRDAADRVADMLRQVGLSPDRARDYPAQLSGGQRQRVAVARALMVEPDLVVCDEPTSALDLSVQAQILNLLLDLQRQLGVSYVFISHDIAVVRHVSHRVVVLLDGQVMEHGDARVVTETPRHPYTAALLAAAPVPEPGRQAARRVERRALQPTARATPPARGVGCPFAGRCPSEVDKCRAVRPVLRADSSGRAVACHVHGPAPFRADAEMAAA